jgi:hypothetical protein
VEAAADAEMLRMRFSLGELQGRCDRQAKEIAQLRRQACGDDMIHGQESEFFSTASPFEPAKLDFSSSLTKPLAASATSSKPACCEQECQTEERAFTEQLDAIHREAASKSKEVRKLQETVQLLQAELQQEKMVALQYREQVEGLEQQLQDAMKKQHRAEGERNLVEWHLRNAEGSSKRPGTGCAPRPTSSRSRMKAWGEAVEPGRQQEEQEFQSSRGYPQEVDKESAEESAVESDGSEGIEVYHPPPSRAGMRRSV